MVKTTEMYKSAQSRNHNFEKNVTYVHIGSLKNEVAIIKRIMLNITRLKQYRIRFPKREYLGTIDGHLNTYTRLFPSCLLPQF